MEGSKYAMRKIRVDEAPRLHRYNPNNAPDLSVKSISRERQVKIFTGKYLRGMISKWERPGEKNRSGENTYDRNQWVWTGWEKLGGKYSIEKTGGKRHSTMTFSFRMSVCVRLLSVMLEIRGIKKFNKLMVLLKCTNV